MRLESFADSIKEKELHVLEEDICEFFFGCNIPLSVVESHYFQKMLMNLRPAVKKLPSRKQLSDTLLDKTYDCIIQEVDMVKWENIQLSLMVGKTLLIIQKLRFQCCIIYQMANVHSWKPGM